MHRILTFIESEARGLHEAAYLLGAFAIGSTLLALLRDRILASTFGAGELLDVYYAAFRIPDVIFVSVASLVSVFILVPLLSERSEESERHDLIGNVLFGFSCIIIAFSVLLWFCMPYLVSVLFPVIYSGQGELLTLLSRILLIQPVLLGLSGIFASITQFHGRYLLYAIAPLLYNLWIIIGIVTLYPIWGLAGIGYGVVIGACFHALIQVPFVLRMGYLRPQNFVFKAKQFMRIVSTSFPRTISLATNQFALFALIIFASTLGAGAVSIFSLAFNIQSAPLSIIGASYSVAAFPTLARFIHKGLNEHFCEQIITASRHIIFWSIPITALFVVLRAHIVRVVFGAGAFDWTDTRLTAAALALFAIALCAQALSLLFVRGYYAAGETRKPLMVNVFTGVGIVASAYGLLQLFAYSPTWQYFIEDMLRVEGIVGTEVLMLPLAYALCTLTNAFIFLYLFERDFGSVYARLRTTFFQSFSAAVTAGFFAHQMLGVLSGVFNINTLFGVFALGFIAGVVGIVAGILLLYILDSNEIREVSQTLHHRFWQNAPIFSGGTERADP